MQCDLRQDSLANGTHAQGLDLQYPSGTGSLSPSIRDGSELESWSGAVGREAPLKGH